MIRIANDENGACEKRAPFRACGPGPQDALQVHFLRFRFESQWDFLIVRIRRSGWGNTRPAPRKLQAEPPGPARRARRLDPTTGTQPHQNAESVAESTVLVAQTRSIRKNPSLLMSNCGMWLQGIHQVPSLVCWWPIGYTCDLPLGFDWERAIRSNTSECDRGRYADGEFAE